MTSTVHMLLSNTTFSDDRTSVGSASAGSVGTLVGGLATVKTGSVGPRVLVAINVGVDGISVDTARMKSNSPG